MEAILYGQLLPVTGATTARRWLDSLDHISHDPGAERPYTLVNFVVSADGRTTVEGRSRKLSDPGDRELHRTLRERADAVLAGTGTLAAEDYGRMLPAAERRDRRLADGRTAEPLAVTVTRSGHVPLNVRLFAEPEAKIVIFSPDPPPAGADDGARAEIQRQPLDPSDPHPLTTVLQTLRRHHGVRILLCEGGPTLLAALLQERLVDELFLTIAPVLTGGDGPTFIADPVGLPATSSDLTSPTLDLTLTGLLEREGSLFLRYRLR